MRDDGLFLPEISRVENRDINLVAREYVSVVVRRELTYAEFPRSEVHRLVLEIHCLTGQVKTRIPLGHPQGMITFFAAEASLYAAHSSLMSNGFVR